jgi:hypothetical protein
VPVSAKTHPVPASVQLVGIASLLHGVLLALVGVGLVLMAPLQLLEGEELGVVIIVGLIGLAWAVVGPVQAVCGARVLQRRGRQAAVTVNVVALVVTLPMCCALSLGLGVLSTVLLSQDEAVRWFAEAEV